MKYDVITIGAAVRDVYVKSDAFHVTDYELEPGTQRACFVLGGKIEVDAPLFSTGGGATNAAATFAHLGKSVACVAKIGDDDAGRSIRTDLEHHGAHSDLLVVSRKEQTGYSTLLTADNGQRTAIVYRGASATLQQQEINWKQLDAPWMYLTSLGGDLALTQWCLDHAKKRGMEVAWNPGSTELAHGWDTLAPLIKRVAILSLNKEEAQTLSGHASSEISELLRYFSRECPGITVITDGKRGTYAVHDGDAYFAAPTDVPVINTTGSGDAFGSAFTTGIIEYDNLVNALQLGTLNAESVIQQVGSKNGILPRLPGTRRLSSINVTPYQL